MAQEVSKITISVNRDIQDIIVAKQMDANSRFLEVSLVHDDGVAVDLSGHVVRFNARKPDFTTVFNECKIKNAPGGVFLVELTDQTLALPGVVMADISVHTEDEEVILTTRTFCIRVQAMVRDDGAIESSNEFGAVILLFQDVYDMRQTIIDINDKQGELTDDLPSDWGDEQAGSSMFGALNRMWNYLKTQSTAGIVDLINQIKTLIGSANPTVDGTDTVMNYLLRIFKKPNPANVQVFLSNGTFRVPAGVTTIYVTACGGGGSGMLASSTPGVNGTSTVIGSLITLAGGGGGTTAGGGAAGGAGGGAGSTSNPTAPGAHGITGRGGMHGGAAGAGGGSLGGGGGGYISNTIVPISGESLFPGKAGLGSFGSGGGGGTTNMNGGGGAAAIYKQPYAVTPAQNINITVGLGGSQTSRTAAGGSGIAIIEW